tara:strand:- start:21 stop:443 length:423 start_codon:yes stop_codon:yes gene_type:complete
MKKILLTFMTVFISCTNTIELSQAQKIWCKQTYNESLPAAVVGTKILRNELPGDKQKVLDLAQDDIDVINSLEYVLEEIFQDEVDVLDDATVYLLFLKKHNLKDPEAGNVAKLFESSENKDIQTNRDQVCLLWYEINHSQ